jgi:hypothetical protein
MICKISCSALAFALFALFAGPVHAGLSGVDPTGAVETPAPAPATEPAAAPATEPVAAPPPARAQVAAVPPAAEPLPRKTVAHKAKPRHVAIRRRFGFPCH